MVVVLDYLCVQTLLSSREGDLGKNNKYLQSGMKLSNITNSYSYCHCKVDIKIKLLRFRVCVCHNHMELVKIQNCQTLNPKTISSERAKTSIIVYSKINLNTVELKLHL